VPPALHTALARLREHTSFEFGRVLSLPARIGRGRQCFVIPGTRGGTLVMSERIAEALPADQLLAVLAHEAAHVLLRHGPRKVAWAVGMVVASIAAAFANQFAIYPLLPAWVVGFARLLFTGIPLLFARQFYELYVTRRHEAEADDFAVDVAGPDALLGALEGIVDFRVHEALLHNRWTTHGTWERRTGRIRARRT